MEKFTVCVVKGAMVSWLEQLPAVIEDLGSIHSLSNCFISPGQNPGIGRFKIVWC